MNEGLVYLVDEDESVLREIAQLLDEAGYEVRPFRSAEDFLESHDTGVAGCAVFGLATAGPSGLDLHCEMRARGHARPTVFITGEGSVPLSVRAMKAGAVDVLTKPVHGEDLVAAVCAALKRDLLNRRAQSEIEAVARRVSCLTLREREVMDHVVMGRLNKQIAARLRISEKTVKVHRARVMNKLDVRSVADLVRIADHMSAPESVRTFLLQHRDLRRPYAERRVSGSALRLFSASPQLRRSAAALADA